MKILRWSLTLHFGKSLENMQVSRRELITTTKFAKITQPNYILLFTDVNYPCII